MIKWIGGREESYSISCKSMYESDHCVDEGEGASNGAENDEGESHASIVALRVRHDFAKEEALRSEGALQGG